MPRALTFLLLLAACFSGAAGAEPPAPPSNPFAGFETWVLPNGLRVWYKQLADDPQVSISVVVPYGSDLDPPGKEQLAHFTEHMLFADHLGRTEEQIKREIEDRGGVRNGFTRPDRTFYFVRIGKEHGPFAVEWLYRIVSPHAMDSELVERQREPVALEVGARPRQLLDWVLALYVDPAWLRLPGFWEREFGIETREARDYDPYRSLHRIGAEDLRRFYDSYYVPSRMTLTVIGDLDRARVREVVDRTFATLAVRTAPELPDTLRDPRRYRQTIAWVDRPAVSYSRYFKLYRPTAREQQLLQFVRKHLERRLDARLRYGERKATYRLPVEVVQRGRAAYLSISGNVKDEQFEFARGVIDEELAALKAGSLEERDAVVSFWRAQNASAWSLGEWARSSFYDPSLHEDFPDLVTFAETLTSDELQGFARGLFVPEREVLAIIYRHPFSQSVLGMLAVMLVGLTVWGARRALVLPVDMTRIRYVGRLRLPVLYKLLGLPLLVVVVAVVMRLAAQLYLALADRFLFPVESFSVQWLVFAATLVAAVLVVVLLLSWFPRKLLVFDDHLRIKYLAYRSRRWAPGEIAEVALLRFSDVWARSRRFRCVPLTFGILHPGIYLRHTSGRAWFFRVRRADLVVQLVERLREEARLVTAQEAGRSR